MNDELEYLIYKNESIDFIKNKIKNESSQIQKDFHTKYINNLYYSFQPLTKCDIVEINNLALEFALDQKYKKRDYYVWDNRDI
jgi:hypothetical protein